LASESPAPAPRQTMPKQVSDTLTFLLNPRLRIGRLRFLARLFLTLICLLASLAVTAALLFGHWLTFSLVALSGLVVFFFLVMVFATQRLHDMGLDGRISWLVWIPALNLLLLLLLSLYPGNRKANRFGPKPPKNRFWHWLAGLVMPVVMTALMGSSTYVVVSQLYTAYSEQVRLGAGEAPLPEPAAVVESETSAESSAALPDHEPYSSEPSISPADSASDAIYHDDE